jgi:transcriptional regulator with XRE-family HTH domain
MKEIKDIRDIKNIERLENEYDLQKALLLDRKLRLLIKEDESLKPVRQKLRKLIKDYEDKYWSDSEKITDSQFLAAEEAESEVEKEREFIKQRKEIIFQKLKNLDMNQQELGQLLGHGKTYISELMNGVSKFSLKDLLIIHHVLDIDLEKLIPPFLQNETKENLKESILKLNKPKLKSRKRIFF